MPLGCDNPATHACAVGCRTQFNVVEDVRPSLLLRVIILMVNKFILQGAEQALHYSIVVTIPFTAHATHDPVAF